MQTLLVLAALVVPALCTQQYFDLTAATDYARLCAVSYCPKANITAWGCEYCHESGYQLHSIGEYGENLYYTAFDRSTKEVVVVFRGTEPTSITQWIEDADFLLTDFSYVCSGCKVESGFHDAYSQLESVGVISDVQYLSGYFDTTQVTVVGHSLGASIATIAASVLISQYELDVTLYNFGSPRVGNPAFSDWASSGVFANGPWRVVNYKDIVPSVPFELMGYEHVYTLVWEDKSGDTTIEYDELNPDVFQDSVLDHGHYLGVDFLPFVNGLHGIVGSGCVGVYSSGSF